MSRRVALDSIVIAACAILVLVVAAVYTTRECACGHPTGHGIPRESQGRTNRGRRRHRVRSRQRVLRPGAGHRLDVPAAGDVEYARARALRLRADTRRHAVRGRRVREVRRLVRSVLGAREVDHEACAGKPRVRVVRCDRLLPVLRPCSRRSQEGLLQLRRRAMAPDRPELQLLGGRGLWSRLAPGAVAAPRPRGPSGGMHARLLAPPAVLVRVARERLDVHGVLASVVRRGRGRRPQRPRPRLRAFRARRRRGAIAILVVASASSSSARAARSYGRSRRSGQTARHETRPVSACSS